MSTGSVNTSTNRELKHYVQSFPDNLMQNRQGNVLSHKREGLEIGIPCLLKLWTLKHLKPSMVQYRPWGRPTSPAATLSDFNIHKISFNLLEGTDGHATRSQIS